MKKRYGPPKGDLDRPICLSIGFERLRERLSERRDKSAQMLSSEEFKRRGIRGELPTISAEDDEEGSAISPRGDRNKEDPESVQEELPGTIIGMGSENQNDVSEEPGIGESAISILGGVAILRYRLVKK